MLVVERPIVYVQFALYMFRFIVSLWPFTVISIFQQKTRLNENQTFTLFSQQFAKMPLHFFFTSAHLVVFVRIYRFETLNGHQQQQNQSFVHPTCSYPTKTNGTPQIKY